MRNGEITNYEFESDVEWQGWGGGGEGRELRAVTKKTEMRSAGQDSDPRLPEYEAG